jgi:phosphoserine aminotransferase
MIRRQRPQIRPQNPHFSAGPCAKRPGWSPAVLDKALTGRSHRSADGRARLRLAIDKTKSVLALPAGYQAAIVPGSDTGAFEMAMWNLLGERGVDVFAWDVFGRIWLKDATDELRLTDARTLEAGWGRLPDLSKADFSRDVLFTWNGTTSGVRVPNADWINADRQGLTFCDATSALFGETIDFQKIDVLTYSWQKGLGGEAAHGMLILSPRAMERLRSHRPRWPVPKVFQLKTAGGILEDLFEGVTINTPSMLCVEDYLDALTWVENIGGLDATIARTQANAGVIYDWIAKTPWAEPLAEDPATRSNTSVCLRMADEDVLRGGPEEALRVSRAIAGLLESEGVAFDIASYRGVPAGLRIWTGPTIEKTDVLALTHWLDWAYGEVKDR